MCRGESVLALVALWSAGKRLLFSFPCPVIALSIVTTSHALAQVKILSALVHLLHLVAERWVPGSVNSYSLDRCCSLHSA